jgi:hypothetical protein
MLFHESVDAVGRKSASTTGKKAGKSNFFGKSNGGDRDAYFEPAHFVWASTSAIRSQMHFRTRFD